MDPLHFAKITLILNLVTTSFCWQYFTTLSDFQLSGSAVEPDLRHSEYIFGNCNPDNANMAFYTHVYLDHMDVLGKVIIRGWLDLYRIPTCIILRAKSHVEDTYRNTLYNFQICVPRITYCHSKRRFMYFYYEWYIPSDYLGGMNWDIYFFGPPNAAW